MKDINKILTTRIKIETLFLICLFPLLNFSAYSQPTPREYRYVWSWNGVDVWEKPDINAQKITHLAYGDSVIINKTTQINEEAEIEIFSGTVEYGKEFPEWKVKSKWIAVSTRLQHYGYIPEIYLSPRKPFKFSTKTQQSSENIEEYFARIHGLLESKIVEKESIWLTTITRLVFKSGIVYEIPYNTYGLQNYALIMPDMTLVEAFFFLNVAHNLEMEERGGKSDFIRLILTEDDLLRFTNHYPYSEVKKGERRKIYTIREVSDFVAISIEELIID
jgi:hypothetical protein